ncbi:MAG: VOC family protein [Nanoarchaeota archaeon]|nr:VOC family protein [Nanoarchaeota archaeon]
MKLNNKPKLNAIIIGVNNIDKVLDFYLNVFEIKINERKNNYLSAYLNDTFIEIEEDCKDRFPNWKKHNVGTYKNSEFIVQDINLFIKKVKDNGGKVISPPTERPWNAITAEIADPDGNIFLITQDK